MALKVAKKKKPVVQDYSVSVEEFCRYETISEDGVYGPSHNEYKVLNFKNNRFQRERGYIPRIATEAVVIPNVIKGFKKSILVDGDEGAGAAIVEGMPTVSFNCLSMLIFKKLGWNGATAKQRTQLEDLLIAGTLKLVDFRPDETRSLTQAEKNKIKGKTRKDILKILKPPLGFTYIDKSYHRSATCLFRDTRAGGQSFLVGQDDGSYFGCELVGHPRKIEEAYRALMPKEAVGKTHFRQGEWFFVRVDEKQIPKLKIGKINFCDGGLGVGIGEDTVHFALPRDSKQSAIHYVLGTNLAMENGVLYVKDIEVEHSDDGHPTLSSKGWHTVHKNLAVRSVSVDGVD